jgi:hypothetical protein
MRPFSERKKTGKKNANWMKERRNQILVTRYFCDTFLDGHYEFAGRVVDFDFSDQIRDTSKDETFAQCMASEYGVPVRFGEGWVRP